MKAFNKTMTDFINTVWENTRTGCIFQDVKYYGSYKDGNDTHYYSLESLVKDNIYRCKIVEDNKEVFNVETTNLNEFLKSLESIETNQLIVTEAQTKKKCKKHSCTCKTRTTTVSREA